MWKTGLSWITTSILCLHKKRISSLFLIRKRKLSQILTLRLRCETWGTVWLSAYYGTTWCWYFECLSPNLFLIMHKNTRQDEYCEILSLQKFFFCCGLKEFLGRLCTVVDVCFLVSFNCCWCSIASHFFPYSFFPKKELKAFMNFAIGGTAKVLHQSKKTNIVNETYNICKCLYEKYYEYYYWDYFYNLTLVS